MMHPSGSPKELSGELSYLRPFLIDGEIGRLSFFTTFRHFGPPVDECIRLIKNSNPDLCFFSVFAFCYGDDAIALALAIKKELKTPVVFGGGGPSAYPDYFLRQSGIDFVLTGEAEASIGPFLTEIERAHLDFTKVPNLHWKHDGSLHASPQISAPPKEQIEVGFMKSSETSRAITFSTSLSRGCPKKCNFCSSHLVFGKTFRMAPIDHIADALQRFSIDCSDTKKQVVINLEDDNLLADESHFKAVITLFRQHFPGAKFIAENGIDYSFITPEFCDWLIENGMQKFNLSLGSLNREILSKKHRPLHLNRFERIIGRLSEKGIPSVTYFICGFKEDTLETIAANLLYLARSSTLVGISMFYPVPGIDGFTDKSIFDTSPSLRCLGSVAYPWNQSLSTETMITAFRLSRYINLLKSSKRSENENQLLAIIANRCELHTMIREKSGQERIVPVPRQEKNLVGMVVSGIIDSGLWPLNRAML